MGVFRRLTRAGAALAVAAIGALLIASPAAAYDSGAAASYADQWALGRNFQVWGNFANDCTNFVSQSLHAGGYSMVNYGANSTDDNNWWFITGTNYSHSWTVANDHYNFENWHYPGGWSNGTRSGTDGGATVNTTGDLYFYDFGDGAGINHVSIETSYGTDPNSGWTGDLVDAHSNDRYHAIWSLSPYNVFRSTTTVYLIHIDPNNN